MNPPDHAREDEHLRGERRTLYELLDRFPAQLRLDDVRDRVTPFEAEPSFGDYDLMEEAVAELVGYGLAFRQGQLVIPTLSALHFDLLTGPSLSAKDRGSPTPRPSSVSTPRSRRSPRGSVTSVLIGQDGTIVWIGESGAYASARGGHV
jgi:hypothetical protein